jgi:hypothetical protein
MEEREREECSLAQQTPRSFSCNQIEALKDVSFVDPNITRKWKRKL